MHVSRALCYPEPAPHPPPGPPASSPLPTVPGPCWAFLNIPDKPSAMPWGGQPVRLGFLEPEHFSSPTHRLVMLLEKPGQPLTLFQPLELGRTHTYLDLI